MARPRFIHVTFLALLAHGALAKPTYPVTARLETAPEMSGACDPARIECGIVAALREAFQGAIARMFEPGPAPNLRLVLSVKSAQTGQGVGGNELTVVALVRVLTPEGETIDELEALGRGPLVVQPADVALAESRASQDCARDFERRYANSTKIGDYLVTKKVAPAAAVGVSGRSEKLFSAFAGLGAMQGGGDGGTAIAPSLRLAVTVRWFTVQLSYLHASASYQAESLPNTPPGTVPATLSINDLGLEAGFAWRLSPVFELHAGPGIHYFTGDGTRDPQIGSAPSTAAASSYSTFSPDLFASLSGSFFLSRNGPRFVAGVEARAFFFTNTDLPDSGRTVPAANTYFGAFLGFEFPVGAKEGRSDK
jgi:hypothetical protein